MAIHTVHKNGPPRSVTITQLTQDNVMIGPASNTRPKTRHVTIMQECMWAAWDKKQQTATLCQANNEFVGAVLDETTGKLLEYL